MALTVACTDCGKRYAVSAQSAGKRFKCKNCGNVFAVPGDAAAPSRAPAPNPAGTVGRPVSQPCQPIPVQRPVLTPPPLPRRVVEDPFDPDYDGDNLLSALEQAEPLSTAPPALSPPPQVRAAPSRVETIASSAAGVAGGVASAVVPLTGNIAASLGVTTWIGIGAVILGLATCRLAPAISILGRLPLTIVALVTLVMAWFRVYRAIIHDYWERLFCRLVPGAILLFLLLRLNEAAEHSKLIAKAIVLVAVTVGCYYLAHDAAQSRAEPQQSAFFNGMPNGGTLPGRPASYLPTGQKGFVNLQIVTEGYPGDPDAFRTKVEQTSLERLKVDGIGVNPGAPMTLKVVILRSGDRKLRVTPLPGGFPQPGQPGKIVTVDDVYARILLVEPSTRVVYTSQLAVWMDLPVFQDRQEVKSSETS